MIAYLPSISAQAQQDMTISKKRIFGSTMLVTGCCIGAGMIGLPVVSAMAGLMPSTLAMFLCYIFTTFTGLLLVEATLWFDTKINLPTIVAATLGRYGKMATIFLFLFLFYCLFVAYLDAGGSLFAEIMSYALQTPISNSVGVLTCMGFVFAVSYAGAHVVDHFNRVLLVGLVVSYFILVIVGLPHVEPEHLRYQNWSAIFGVIPILLLCFGYQNLVPSLTYYLHKNVKAIRFAIIVGNMIPFFIYFLWNYVILGLLSPDHINKGRDAEMVVELLQASATPAVSVMFFIKSFSLFAMLTSFIPNAVSFVDFLRDGFSKLLQHKVKSNIYIYTCVFVPPTVCALMYPRIFLNALSFAGGFIDVLLYGVIPASVVLVGRRFMAPKGAYQVMGGSLTPAMILLISLFLLLLKMM